MENVLDLGGGDARKKGLRLVIGAVVATVVLEMMMQVGAPDAPLPMCGGCTGIRDTGFT